MTKCAGWNLHLDRCPEFDDGGKAVFSVNIVMPYCRDNGNDTPVTTTEALKDYPQFLFPHLWSGTDYRLYWNNGAGLPTQGASLKLRSDWQMDQARAAADAV